MTLNELMSFEHVIQIHDDGSISAPRDIWAPEPWFDTADEPMDDSQWTWLRGWTGQYCYHGAHMHPSEYIGGALERHIRETPGYWAAVVFDDHDSWGLAFREA